MPKPWYWGPDEFAPAPKDLPPPGVALPDWWIWKVVAMGCTDVQRWNC